MDSIAGLSAKEREALFRETASSKGITNAIVEKDFWVVWVLDKLFLDPELGKVFMFKGGTSLSKVYKLIQRFSEDIDLILDWQLITQENPQEERSNNKQSKFNSMMNEDAKLYIKEKLLPKLKSLLAPYCKCVIDEDDGLKVNINYPSVFEKDQALLSHILLEIGPLAMWQPNKEFEIISYVAEKFPKQFKRPIGKVKAILAKRTFWEKATILHLEANRSKDKIMLPRHSRHYYDLAMMSLQEVKGKALDDLELLKDVIEFKDKFYHCGWAQYDQAKPGTFKLVPPEFRLKELKDDYAKMRSMIYGDYPDFEVILERLKRLEEEINNLRM